MLLILLLIFKISNIAIAQTPSAITSSVKMIPSFIELGGTSTIVIQIQDADVNKIIDGGETITFQTTSLGTISSIIDNNNGSYTATYSGSFSAGIENIVPILNGINFSNTTCISLS